MFAKVSDDAIQVTHSPSRMPASRYARPTTVNQGDRRNANRQRHSASFQASLQENNRQNYRFQKYQVSRDGANSIAKVAAGAQGNCVGRPAVGCLVALGRNGASRAGPANIPGAQIIVLYSRPGCSLASCFEARLVCLDVSMEFASVHFKASR